MGRACKCDKCGALFEYTVGKATYPIGEVVTSSGQKRTVCISVVNHNEAFDLCDKCKQSFLEWWKEELK